MPTEVAGSRLPVGSSARRIRGRLTKALATETRCCSPPESCRGKRSALALRPTSLSTCGTWVLITCRGRPVTSRAKATFSYTVLFGSSLKSWKTVPIERRRCGTFQAGSFEACLPAIQMSPLLGRSSRIMRRISVDFPEPEGPTRNTNSPLAIWSSTSLTATTPPS